MARKIRNVSIGNRLIGEDEPVFVIAEVGINHNGDAGLAKRLVDAAVDAKADCIKFQTHITEKEMIHTDMKPGEISNEKLWDIIRRCELTADEEKYIKEYCEKKGIMFLSTPFSREAADRLERLNVPAYKIGSGEITNLPLIEHIARKGKPMIVSTGMTEIYEVKQTVDLVKSMNVPLILMQCTSTYPTKYSDVKLGAIELLKEKFGVPVGLSDHSIGIYTALGAVAKGACALEKHFTLDRNWPGPDQGLSIEPYELKELVKGARAIKQALGLEKKIINEELPVLKFARECVVAISDIKAGEQLSLENIWVKRPADGEIPAKDLGKVLGKVAKRDIKYDAQIKWEYLK